MDVLGEWMDDGGWIFGWINGCEFGGGSGGDSEIRKGGMFQREEICIKQLSQELV